MAVNNPKTAARTGVVVSDKMKKTIVVRIDSVTHHRLYSKILRRSVKVKAHDEKNSAKIGDTVRIVQTRPISKDKRWKLAEIVSKKAEGDTFDGPASRAASFDMLRIPRRIPSEVEGQYHPEQTSGIKPEVRRRGE